MKQRWNPYFLLAAGPLLVLGCSNGKSSAGSCKMAITQASADIVSAHEGHNATGGYLEISAYPDHKKALSPTAIAASELRRVRCTVVIEPKDERLGIIKVYTAKHCLAFHTMAKFELYLSIDGAYYNLPVRLEALEKATKAMALTKNLPEDAQLKVAQAISGKIPYRVARELVKLGSGAGSRTSCDTKLDENGRQNLCALYGDLAEIEAHLSLADIKNATHRATVREALKNRVQYRQALRKKLPEPMASFAKGAEEAGQAYRASMASLSTVDVVDALASCTAQSTDALCSAKESILPILGVLSPAATVALKEAEAQKKAGENYIQKKAQEFINAHAALQKQMESLAPIVKKNANNVSLLANFAISKEHGVGVAKPTGGAQATPIYFASLPFAALFKGISSELEIRDKALFFSIPSKNRLAEFRPGDSGSTLSAFGIVPLAVLTLVNDDPTSEGAALEPLPQPRNETRNTTVAKAPEKKSNEGGKNLSTLLDGLFGAKPKAPAAQPAKPATQPETTSNTGPGTVPANTTSQAPEGPSPGAAEPPKTADAGSPSEALNSSQDQQGIKVATSRESSQECL